MSKYRYSQKALAKLLTLNHIQRSIFLIESWNFNDTGDSYFCIKTTKMVSWICYFLFLRKYLGLRFGYSNCFWDYVLQYKSQFDRCIFSMHFPNYEKLHPFVEKVTPCTGCNNYSRHAAKIVVFGGPYTVKNCFAVFPSPDGMSLTKLFIDGNMFPLLSLKLSLSQAGILTESFWIS